MKSKEFDNILDECLEQLLVKGETIEQCLQSYPEQAAELEPLLQTALAAGKAVDFQPRPEFRAKARYQFRAALREMEGGGRHSLFGWFPRWATSVAIVLVVLVAGSGTVAAASNSMPDSPLYSVKLATEQVRLVLTPSPLGKAEFCASLADRRVEEILYAAGKGNPRQVERVTRELDVCLTRLSSLASSQGEKGGVTLAPTPAPAPAEVAPESTDGGERTYSHGNNQLKLKLALKHHAQSHPAALREKLKTVPPSTRAALLRAIAVSEDGYEKVLKTLD